MSSTIVTLFKAELAAFHTSKGAIRFQPDRPLPVNLIRRIIKARIAENKAAGSPSRASRDRKR